SAASTRSTTAGTAICAATAPSRTRASGWASSAPSPTSPALPMCATPSRSRGPPATRGTESAGRPIAGGLQHPASATLTIYTDFVCYSSAAAGQKNHNSRSAERIQSAAVASTREGGGDATEPTAYDDFQAIPTAWKAGAPSKPPAGRATYPDHGCGPGGQP